MPAAIIQRFIQQQQIGDFEQASDETKLAISILAFKEIQHRLEVSLPRNISRDSFIEYEEAFHEITTIFYNLRDTKLWKDYLIGQIIASIEAAFASVSYILQLVEEGKRNSEYYQQIITLKSLIFAICTFFKEEED